jgi:hypothetical protein
LDGVRTTKCGLFVTEILVRATLTIVASAAALALVSLAAHAACDAKSPDHLVALIELYTSEGCDSCPPADNWLSRIVSGDGASRAVPIAFHVDYWDRLGWKDRFASAKYTDRQYEQMRRQRTTFVFTPQVMLQGRDFGQWRAIADPAAAIAAVNARRPRANIELTVAPQGTNAIVDVHVQVSNLSDRSRAVVAVALVQSKLSSDVKAGENSGKRLTHDHVVRQWHAGPAALDAAGETRQRFMFAIPGDVGPMSIVAFAEDMASGEVLQALALPFCARF